MIRKIYKDAYDARYKPCEHAAAHLAGLQAVAEATKSHLQGAGAKPTGAAKSFDKRESDALMQIIHALDDLAEPWLEGAQEASGTGEKDYERRDMLVHSVLTSAGNGLLALLREHGPEGYFPRTESLKRDPNLLTAARDHIRRLERKLAASTPAPSSPGVPDSVRALSELEEKFNASRKHALENAERAKPREDLYDYYCGQLGQASAYFHAVRAVRTLIFAHPVGQSDDGAERCIACDKPLKAGERILPDASGGTIHTACCGPEREGCTKGDGEPLGPNDPIPQGYVYEPERLAGQSTGQGADAKPDAGRLQAVAEASRALLSEARDGLAAYTGGEEGACSDTIARIDTLLSGHPAGQTGTEDDAEKIAWIILANLRTDVPVAKVRQKLDEEQSGRFGLGRSWTQVLDTARRQARAILAARPMTNAD